MQLNYFTYRREGFTCSKCGWTGKGADLSFGDLSEESLICDLDCPACSEHLGFFQSPLKEEVEKWREENPGVDTGWEDL
jgi:hypothetical protein